MSVSDGAALLSGAVQRRSSVVPWLAVDQAPGIKRRARRSPAKRSAPLTLRPVRHDLPAQIGGRLRRSDLSSWRGEAAKHWKMGRGHGNAT